MKTQGAFLHLERIGDKAEGWGLEAIIRHQFACVVC